MLGPCLTERLGGSCRTLWYPAFFKLLLEESDARLYRGRNSCEPFVPAICDVENALREMGGYEADEEID